MNVLRGQKPDITPAQLLAVVIAGVPVIATLLHVFGVYELTAEQQDALTKTIQWGGLMAISLFGADAGLRAARNHATGRIEAARATAAATPPSAPPAAPAVSAPPTGEAEISNGHQAIEPGLPSDDEEFAGFGPDHDPGPDSRVPPVSPDEEEQLI